MCKIEIGNYVVIPQKAMYMDNNLAILLICVDEENYGSKYGNLTTNLGVKLPKNYAYVDTNNIYQAEEVIAKYKLGKFTGEYGYSGFCKYPLYVFDETKLC